MSQSFAAKYFHGGEGGPSPGPRWRSTHRNRGGSRRWQASNTKGQRYDAALFSILAGLAVLLAAIGLYGLISQSIAQRTHELGIRLALGATARQAIADAIKPGILLALAGVVAGGLLARVAVRFMEHLLFGIRSTDPLTFAATAGILLMVTVLASLVPALRILRLDPARTLRNE